ncbi:hypothetical protein EX011_21310 [Salmonella enterica]|nr:hypothetical protein [Salmonella enterica]EBL7042064.1 hypothetical protein [Salmonella enterica]
MSSFDQLMATLNAIDAEAPAAAPVEEMAKALPSEDADDDKKIQAAEAEADSDSDKEEDEGEDKGEGEDLEKCNQMKKSFENEEGEELIDATEIIEGLQKSFATHDDILAKAMPKIADLLGAQSKQLKEQGELIKSMQDQLATFGARGNGRKSTVTVMAKSHVATQAAPAPAAEEMTVEDIMVKANSLFDQKLLSGLQLTKLDVALRSGYAPDADVLAVLAKH